jgi:hypothetical protein
MSFTQALMLINRDNISYTSKKEKRRKNNPKHVFGFRKETKIYPLGLGSSGAPEPTRSR